jgi:hypothetical protein
MMVNQEKGRSARDQSGREDDKESSGRFMKERVDRRKAKASEQHGQNTHRRLSPEEKRVDTMTIRDAIRAESREKVANEAMNESKEDKLQ